MVKLLMDSSIFFCPIGRGVRMCSKEKLVSQVYCNVSSRYKSFAHRENMEEKNAKKKKTKNVKKKETKNVKKKETKNVKKKENEEREEEGERRGRKT